MVTIQDVAKRAGVAPITVSRVLNSSGYFSKDVELRVREAASELGYVPNSLASSLRSRKTNTLALVVTDIANPFFTSLARGVEDVANREGYMVVICNTDERQDKEEQYVQMLLQRRVDGILMVPTPGTESLVQQIRNQKTAIVLLDRALNNVEADLVRGDSEAAGYALTKLLLDLGHREIGILGGPEAVSTSDDRISGAIRALWEAGLKPSSIQRGTFTRDSGIQQANAALERRPTALLAVSNLIAIGALEAVQSRGQSVPDDVALVGFDDLPPALVMFPFLTVANQPEYEMGRKAAEMLLERIRGLEEPPREHVFPVEILVRQSSGGRRV